MPHLPSMKRYWNSNVTSRAIKGEKEDIIKIFETFVGNQENIIECAYLGVRGLWGIGHHCWAAVTERRFSVITLGPFRGINYQDIFVDRVDRVQFSQPSWLAYSNAVVVATFGVIASFPLGKMGLLLLSMITGQDAGEIARELTMESVLSDGWSILLASIFYAVAFTVAWYSALQIARRFIKRGIECRSKAVSVDAFCDPANTESALSLMRHIAHIREHVMQR